MEQVICFELGLVNFLFVDVENIFVFLCLRDGSVKVQYWVNRNSFLINVVIRGKQNVIIEALVS